MTDKSKALFCTEAAWRRLFYNSNGDRLRIGVSRFYAQDKHFHIFLELNGQKLVRDFAHDYLCLKTAEDLFAELEWQLQRRKNS